MNKDSNSFEEFFFFLCKVLVVALVAVTLYLARDLYEQKKIDSQVDSFVESFQNLLK